MARPTAGPCLSLVFIRKHPDFMESERDQVLPGVDTICSPTEMRMPQILLISAESPSALEESSRHLADILVSASCGQPAEGNPAAEADADGRKPSENGEADSDFLADVACTLQQQRDHCRCRRFIVCQNVSDAVKALKSPASKRTMSELPPSRSHQPIVFMFPGVGDQYVGMAEGLYKQFEVFRRHVEECADILRPLVGLDVRELLYPPNRRRRESSPGGIDLKSMLQQSPEGPLDVNAERLEETLYVQPVLFTVEYALAKLWLDWDVQPERLVGHSMGEYVAACLAGVFSVEDALRLIAVRARMVSELPRGSMLAVMQSEENLLPLLRAPLSVSLINGPEMCVVAGPIPEMAYFENELKKREILFRRVRNAHAFHSRMMDPIREPFALEVKQVRLAPPHLPFVSNVTGTWITPEQACDPYYWADHATRTARFSDGLEQMWKCNGCVPIEVGPGNTLGMLAMQHRARPAAVKQPPIASMRAGYDNKLDADFILNSVGRLWLSGHHVNWRRLEPHMTYRGVFLPLNPLETDPSSEPLSDHGQSRGETAAAAVPAPRNHVAAPSAIQAAAKASTSGTESGANSDGHAPVQSALKRIWCEVFGLTEIGIDDNFFDLGGHSLHAAKMQIRIEKELRVVLALAVFFQAPTIRELSQHLSSVARPQPGKALLLSQNAPEGLRPLFCFHFLDSARNLERRLSGKWAVYGVESSFHEELRQWHDGLKPSLSMQEVGSRSLAMVRRVQPHGPYFLAGWCFGGTLAFEVACQLTIAGEEVAFLGLLDASYWAGRPRMALPWVRRWVYHARRTSSGGFAYLSRKVKSRRKLDRTRRAQLAAALSEKRVLAKADKEKLRLPQAHFLDYLQMRYRARPYPGNAVLIRSVGDPSFSTDPGSANGWHDIIHGGLHVEDLPCGHMDIAREPNVREVAQRLERHMSAVEAALAFKTMAVPQPGSEPETKFV